MHVFILAGGNATRAFPYSLVMEKSMLRLGGKPIVRIIVERLLRSGVCNPDEITICVLGRYLADFKHEFRDLDVNFSPKPEAIGTATHYFYAAELEQRLKPDDDVVVHYADCVTEIDYRQLVEWYHKNNSRCMVAITKNVRHDYSEVKTDSGIKTLEFAEKPRLNFATWTGIAVMKHGVVKDFIGDVIFARPVDFAADIFKSLTAHGILHFFEYPGVWFDVGNSISYMKLLEKYNKGDLFV